MMYRRALFSLLLASFGSSTQSADAFDRALERLTWDGNVSASNVAATFVTPCMPMYLADYAFQKYVELDCARDSLKSPHPPIIDKKNVADIPDYSSIAVSTRLLQEFVDFLPNLKSHVVVIIGMWHLTQSQFTSQFKNIGRLQTILENKWVLHVFMQNPELLHPDYEPLAYGWNSPVIKHMPAVLARSARMNWLKPEQVYISPVLRSKHRSFRPDWFPGGEYTGFDQYLQNTTSAHFVTSPGGDRLDTYRHWESLALNAIPITNLPPTLYRDLFCDDMLYVASEAEMNAVLADIKEGRMAYHKPNRDVLLVSYWQQRVALAKKKKKGERLPGCPHVMDT